MKLNEARDGQVFTCEKFKGFFMKTSYGRYIDEDNHYRGVVNIQNGKFMMIDYDLNIRPIEVEMSVVL